MDSGREECAPSVTCAQRYVKEAYSWVVDMDVEKFFDRVNHDKLMSEVAKSVKTGGF